MNFYTVDNSLSPKERIQYHTAITFLFTGIVMCFLSFFFNEYDIKNGVLFYLGTATTFCGAVFGINVLVKNKVIEAESRILENMNSRITKEMKKVDDEIEEIEKK